MLRAVETIWHDHQKKIKPVKSYPWKAINRGKSKSKCAESRLKVHPDIGYRYEHHSGEDIRILLYGHYRITYLKHANGDIDILGVFHGALEIESYLL